MIGGHSGCRSPCKYWIQRTLALQWEQVIEHVFYPENPSVESADDVFEVCCQRRVMLLQSPVLAGAKKVGREPEAHRCCVWKKPSPLFILKVCLCFVSGYFQVKSCNIIARHHLGHFQHKWVDITVLGRWITLFRIGFQSMSYLKVKVKYLWVLTAFGISLFFSSRLFSR